MNTDSDYYSDGRLHYDVQCIDCGNIFDVGKYSIKRGACMYCAGYKPIIGKTDVPTIAPWMIDYFQGGYEEAIQHTTTSSKKIIPKCPYCGNIHDKEVYVHNLYVYHGFKCQCSDGISFPEKFMMCLLNQLNIDYIYQAQTSHLGFDTQKKIYDFYIKNNSIIIETHGEQHYKNNNDFYMSLKEQQENDKFKYQLATSNGIRNYVVIDCRESTLNWIKTSILKSDLPQLLNFSEDDIDWKKCAEFGTKNITKEVCDYYNTHDVSTSDLMKKFHLGKKAITNYLKRGAELGWCRYKPTTTFFSCKPFKVYKDNNFICYGTSAKKFSRLSDQILGIHLDSNGIRKCLIGQKDIYKGYHFELIDNLQLKREVICTYAS